MIKDELIFTADWHLRMDTPRCRTDQDFIATQEAKVRSLPNLPILLAGDLFDNWHYGKLTAAAAVWAYGVIPAELYAIPGNHDLPCHDPDRVGESLYGIMCLMDVIACPKQYGGLRIAEAPFGTIPVGEEADILMLHTYVQHTSGGIIPGVTPQELLKANPNVEVILTGDNHHPFIYESKGRYVINPASLTRQSAAMKDIPPQYVIWKKGKPRLKEFPFNLSDVSDEHLRQKEDGEERINAFIECLNNCDEGASLEDVLDFRKSVQRRIDGNKIKRRTEEAIWQAFDTASTK